EHEATRSVARSAGRDGHDASCQTRVVISVEPTSTTAVQARHVLEERVAERTDELMAILELSRELGSTLELGPLLNLILDRLQTVVPYSGAGILVAEGDRLYQRAHRSALPESAGLRVSYPIAGWHEIWSRLASGEPILIRDTCDNSRPAE